VGSLADAGKRPRISGKSAAARENFTTAFLHGGSDSCSETDRFQDSCLGWGRNARHRKKALLNIEWNGNGKR
jgi:hypothetical protein